MYGPQETSKQHIVYFVSYRVIVVFEPEVLREKRRRLLNTGVRTTSSINASYKCYNVVDFQLDELRARELKKMLLDQELHLNIAAGGINYDIGYQKGG